MYQRSGYPIIFCFLIGLGLQTAARGADVLLLHGHVYTGAPKSLWAQAIAITGSRIEAVGADETVLKRRGSGTRVIDLKGHTVIPGIVDAHMHMLYGALALHGLNLSTAAASITPDQPDLLISRLKEFAASRPNDSILFARADFSTAAPFAPTHELLDRAIADRPLVVHNTSEHALWLNAKALALAGVTDRPVSDSNEERYVLRDASGHPTGVLLEAAMEIMERAVWSRLPMDVQLSILHDASLYLNRFGITTVVNATGNLHEIELFAALRERNQLTVRTRTAFGSVAVPHRLTPEFLADLETARSKYHDDWVSANLVKFFADGSTGLYPPLVYDPMEFKAIVRELDRRGFQLMTHAQRDDTVHLALDAYEGAVHANGPRDRRLRIEHDLIISESDMPRYAQLSIVAAIQPALCCSEIGTNWDPRVATPSDRWHSLSEEGVVLAFSSDWPCIWPPNPFLNVQQAVTRAIWHSDDTANIVGEPLDGAAQAGARPTGKIYAPQERVTVEQAIAAYTRGSAYASFMDDRVGTIEPGKEADIAVLSQDVFQVPSDQISQTEVLMTLVGGKIVYDHWQ